MILNATNSNIVFIGFMGSGKSRVGRAISKRFDMLFLDIDSMIESREDKKIIDIFQESGEKSFRDIEKEFAQLLKKSVQNSVISVGGGFPTAVENIQELGFVVYLDVDFDSMVSELSKRKEEIEKRPLLQNIEMARKIYNSRKEIYEKSANLIFKVESRDIDKVINDIEKLLLKELSR